MTGSSSTQVFPYQDSSTPECKYYYIMNYRLYVLSILSSIHLPIQKSIMQLQLTVVYIKVHK